MRLRSILTERFRRGTTRELISFSCRSLGLAEQLRLPVPLGDRGAIGRRPLLLPLESALAGDAALGLVLTDRERTRIALQQLGELEELQQLVDEVPAQSSGGGWAQARLARHADDAAHHHAKRSAEAAYQAFRGVDGLELVLAGPESAVKDLAGCLRSELAERVVAELRLPVGASPLELSQALAEVAANRATARNAELVRRVTEQAGSPTVAAGLGPVIEALRARRLATVLAAASMTSPGANCPAAGSSPWRWSARPVGRRRTRWTTWSSPRSRRPCARAPPSWWSRTRRSRRSAGSGRCCATDPAI